MLADAADHLMLDVWEFTNDWADIRIGEDSVCLFASFVSDLTEC